MKLRETFLFLVLISIVFAGGCAHRTIPTDMTRYNRNLTNCHISSKYPFQNNKELTTISGNVEEDIGTKMYPWKAVLVDGKYLFNPETNKPIYFDGLKGETVTIKGYRGSGQITMNNPTKPGNHTIHFDNVFYVNKIIGWKYICCDVLNWKGEISSDYCFWSET